MWKTRSCGILLSPVSCRGVVLLNVRLVHVSDFRGKGIVGVGVGEQGADGEEDLGDGEGG